MHSIHDKSMQSELYRPPEDTLKIWKYLEYMYNFAFTKGYHKKFNKQIGIYFNEDGTWKEPVHITRADWHNIENSIITKQRIKQLEKLLKYGKIPRRLPDRQELFTLLKYGQIYDFKDDRYWHRRYKEDLNLIYENYCSGGSCEEVDRQYY